MPLELADANQYLSNHYGEDISGLERLVGGDWSEAFEFTAGGKPYVARFGRHRDDFAKDEAAFAFNARHLPVPEVFFLGSAFGGFCCISERRFGEIIDRLDSSRMEQLVPGALRLLDALRSADTSIWTRRFGTPTTSWKEQLLSVDEENERVFGWHDKMAASAMGDGPYQIGLQYLKANLEALPERQDLLHNDLLHNNVLVQGNDISGVFDWGCAGLGDFVYEFASFTLYAPWHTGMANIDWLAEVKGHYQSIDLIVPDLERRLRCYEVHLALSGLGYSAFRENWVDYEAVALRMLSRMDG